MKSAIFVWVGVLVGCAGGERVLSSPETTREPIVKSEAAPPTPAKSQPDSKQVSDATSVEPAPQAATEPSFEPGMSVAEAVHAVPADLPRMNIEEEALAEPLTRVENYEACGLRPSEHATIQVAIWDGHAVGIDVEVTPKSAEHEQCLKRAIAALVWRDKAKSLNTVRFRL